LEAAHIRPYLGEHTNGVRNGILLRGDIRTLFDRHLIAVEPSTHRVVLSHQLEGTRYSYLHGKEVSLPVEARLRPDAAALSWHREQLQ